MQRTRVVNVRQEQCEVYVGRRRRGKTAADGYFGNPFRQGVVEDAVAAYRTYFSKRVVDDPDFRARVEQLRGKVLGCWCKPNPCHGDVIASYLNRKRQ